MREGGVNRPPFLCGSQTGRHAATFDSKALDARSRERQVLVPLTAHVYLELQMLSKFLIGLGVSLAAVPAMAQDGIYDAMAQGAVDQQVRIANDRIDRHRMSQARNRNSQTRTSRGVTAAQAQACAGKARYRAQYGESDSRVRFLYSKCAAAGL